MIPPFTGISNQPTQITKSTALTGRVFVILYLPPVNSETLNRVPSRGPVRPHVYDGAFCLRQGVMVVYYVWGVMPCRMESNDYREPVVASTIAGFLLHLCIINRGGTLGDPS